MEPLWICCGWLIDGHGDDIKERVLLKIEKNHVTALHPNHSTPAPCWEKGSVLDLRDGTIIPPLVDCHVHLALSGGANPSIGKKQQTHLYEGAEPLLAKHIAASLKAGVFALRDGGDCHGHTLHFKRKRLEHLPFPLFVKVTGKAWHSPNRYGKFLGQTPSRGESLAQAIGRQAADCDHVKVVNSGLNSLKVFGKETPPQFSGQQLQLAFRVAKKKKYRIMVHANGKRAVKDSVHAGCDSIEHGFFMGNDNLDLMSQRRTHWVPTAMTMKALAGLTAHKPLEEKVALKNFESQLEQISRGFKMGVPIALGTDSGSPGVHHGLAYKEEFKVFLQAGLSVPRAVEAASKNGAGLLGIGEQMGTVEVHMPASFLYYRCAPAQLAERLNQPDLIFHDGTCMDGRISEFDQWIQSLLWKEILR